jgi:putative hydrolase of HD superfamily
MSGLLPFLHIAGSLKRVPRAGWIHCRVPSRIESVSDHSWRVAILSLALDDGPHDRQRALRMALLHDLQEALVGDMMPESKSGVSAEDKHRQERDAVAKLVEMLPEGDLRNELPLLFDEYEKGTSATAVFVKDLDKAEMLLQAVEYERECGDSINLQDFFDNTLSRIKTQQVKEMLEKLMETRAVKK